MTHMKRKYQYTEFEFTIQDLLEREIQRIIPPKPKEKSKLG